jgi:hypothetical protein
MFRRKRRNELQSIIFTDGRIVRTFQDGDLVTVVFRDQAESEFTMRFRGVTKHTQSLHACVYDVMHAKLVEQLSGWSFRLSDDDDEVLLALDFQDVEVSY